MLSRRAGWSATAGLSQQSFLLLVGPIVKNYSNSAVSTVQCYHNIIQTIELGILRIRQNESLHHSADSILIGSLKICGLVAVKSLLWCFHLKTLLSFQSMTSPNLCEPRPILAPLGEILCEPRRLWRRGSRAPVIISETVRDTGLVPKDHQQEMAYTGVGYRMVT